MRRGSNTHTLESWADYFFTRSIESQPLRSTKPRSHAASSVMSPSPANLSKREGRTTGDLPEDSERIRRLAGIRESGPHWAIGTKRPSLRHPPEFLAIGGRK